MFWNDTDLGKVIINDYSKYFHAVIYKNFRLSGRKMIVNNSMPKMPIRFTSIAKDGMLYFNDNIEEIKGVAEIKKWMLHDDLIKLIGDEKIQKILKNKAQAAR